MVHCSQLQCHRIWIFTPVPSLSFLQPMCSLSSHRDKLITPSQEQASDKESRAEGGDGILFMSC